MLKKLKKYSYSLHYLTIFFLLILVITALSGCDSSENLKTIMFGTRDRDLTQITRNDLTMAVWNIVRWTFTFLGVIITLIIIYGGVQYMTALGNEEKLEKAKQTIYWAIVGLAVIVSATAIITYLLQKIGTLPTPTP